jgi:hypothetical protein
MDIQKEREAFEKWYYANHPEHGANPCNDKPLRTEIAAKWEVWQAAKAVPEGFAFKDVMDERQRQINQEFYSTENDDEYKQNELSRAAVCYAENVVRRGWVFNSHFGSNVYQEEEAPDLWPWDIDFWKPKNPRRDLVRAAALLIAEIERIDRSTGANQ